MLLQNPITTELELYCHSESKEAKGKQIVSKTASRYENELQKLSDGLHKVRAVKKQEKVIEKLGGLKEKYRKVAYLYEVSMVTDDNKLNVIELEWYRNDNAMRTKERGIYCLRSNRTDLDAKTFWGVYTMLTELEAAFRSLKSELGLRPVYHQKEHRIDAHLFISILAYHLLHTIRYQLKQNGINQSWETLREILDTQCRITTMLKLENGKVVQIRKTSVPDSNQLAIYRALKITQTPRRTEKTYC